MNETILRTLVTFFSATILHVIFGVLYRILITVAIHRDSKKRTFSYGAITFLAFVFPILTPLIYIIYSFRSGRNDPNIVRLQFDRKFKNYLVAGYIFGAASGIAFTVGLLSRGFTYLLAFLEAY